MNKTKEVKGMVSTLLHYLKSCSGDTIFTFLKKLKIMNSQHDFHITTFVLKLSSLCMFPIHHIKLRVVLLGYNFSIFPPTSCKDTTWSCYSRAWPPYEHS